MGTKSLERQAAEKERIRNAIAEQQNINRDKRQKKRSLQRKRQQARLQRQQERMLQVREQREEKYVRELASIAEATVDKALTMGAIDKPREPFIMNKLRQQSMGTFPSRCEACQRRWFS